jgi:hypothetical protein
VVRIDFWLTLVSEVRTIGCVRNRWLRHAGGSRMRARGLFSIGYDAATALYMSYTSYARALEDVEVECDEC